MNIRTGFVIAAGLTIAITPRTVRAQAQLEEITRQMSTDSTAWVRVLTFVVKSFSGYLLLSASDTAKQVWDVRLPANDPQRALHERQLRTILRARPAVPGDSVTNVMEFGPLEMSKDTARVRLTVTTTRRCTNRPNRTTGNMSDQIIIVARRPRFGTWEEAHSDEVTMGDEIGC